MAGAWKKDWKNSKKKKDKKQMRFKGKEKGRKGRGKQMRFQKEGMPMDSAMMDSDSDYA